MKYAAQSRATPAAGAVADTLRIDKLIWYLRFTKSRSAAQKLVATGHLRRNGQRIDRAHAEIHTGDVLTIPQDSAVHVIRIVELPLRRFSPALARQHYEPL